MYTPRPDDEMKSDLDATLVVTSTPNILTDDKRGPIPFTKDSTTNVDGE